MRGGYNIHALVCQGNGKYYVSAVFGYYRDITATDDYKRYLEGIHKPYGDINGMDIDFCYGSFHLGIWIRTQKSRYAAGKLAEDRVKKLEGLGILWSNHDGLWENGFKHAEQFVKENGNLAVPTGYVCEDGFKLKIWLNNQVVRWKNGKMPEEQAERIEKIGMKWGRVRKKET